MKWSAVGAVVAKELRETLRDRRAVMIMIVIPAFLYPALFVVMEQLALFGQRQLQDDAVRVAVLGTPPGELPFAGDSALELVAGDPGSVRAVREGRLDALVEFRRGRNALGTGEALVVYDAARDQSSRARTLVQERLQERADSLLVRRLEAEGLPRTFAEPLAIRDTSIATPQALGGYALGRFLPMILIVMTILGAFYPAIDLSAGEKERGTLEPLLSTPVGEDEIVAGKFVAVTLIALSAATLNLASMLLTFQAGLFQFARAANLEFHLPAGAIVLILFALTMLAVLFSSLFLGIAVRAQSFREAQNALTPIYIVGFLPALLAVMPGIAFSPALALVPVGGIALLFRSLATGNAALLPSIVAVGATIVYAMLALVFAVRAFGREEVLFGSGASEASTGTWGERLERWREARGGVPRAGTALLFVASVALLAFYLGVRWQVAWGERGILAMQWLLLGLPAVLFAALGPYDLRRTLALRRPSARGLAAGVLIALGGLPIGWLLGWLQTFVLELPQELLAALQGLLTADGPGRLLWLVLLVAVTPAICEELVFRGVLLQGLGREMRMGRAVLVSALIFGAFHLSTATAIRFVPTLWIGLLLGFVAWHTRSIFASMLMHFVNNGFTVLLVSFPALQAAVVTPAGVPRWLPLAAGPLLLGIGFFLLPKRSTEPAPAPVDEPAPAPPPALANR